jgi:trimethylamine:corrinoid methyltransferase-like protein
VDQGRPTVVERARRKLESILASHYPSHIAESVDEAIRARLPIRLPREQMRARTPGS